MIDNKLRQTIRKLGHDLVDGINERQCLDFLEEDMLSQLARLDECGLIISGYHRRTSHGKNCIVKPNNGPYMVVMNLLDGEENYSRGSSVYGVSLSLTCMESGRHFTIVYDGLTGQTVDFSEAGRSPEVSKIVNHKRQGNLVSVVGREPRQVFGLGRMFPAGEESLRELEDISIRSLGSTTVSILEVLRGHLDIYVNITKIWNIWWALWLPSHYQLQLEDPSDGRRIQERIPEILSAPDSMLPLVCYRDVAIKRRFSSSLRDFSRHVLRAR